MSCDQVKHVSVNQVKVGDKILKIRDNGTTYSAFSPYTIIEKTGAYISFKLNEKIYTYSTDDLQLYAPLSLEEYKDKYSKKAREIIECFKNKPIDFPLECNHQMDNSWIRIDLWDFAAVCKDHKYEILGYTYLQTPVKTIAGNLDIGIIARHKNGSTFWCHSSSDLIKHLIDQYEHQYKN